MEGKVHKREAGRDLKVEEPGKRGIREVHNNGDSFL
jgi:hypothetical protein